MDVEAMVRKVDQKIESCSQQDVELHIERVWSVCGRGGVNVGVSEASEAALYNSLFDFAEGLLSTAGQDLWDLNIN